MEKIEPSYLTIDNVPSPSEPLGHNLQRLSAKLDVMTVTWNELLNSSKGE